MADDAGGRSTGGTRPGLSSWHQPVISRPRIRRSVRGVDYSVVIPAHNEAALLERGLAAVAEAGRRIGGRVEVIVVANRCTDATADLARSGGATVLDSDARNISAVRNAGAAAATGDVIVTIDADSQMAPTALAEVERLLSTGRFVGGGSRVRPERSSLGIRATLLVVDVLTSLARLSGAMFWCRAEDFRAIGGFNEELLVGEDIDFARRLRTHGRRTGRRLTKLRDQPMIVSTRKFDRFGDWHMFGMALQLPSIWAAMRGKDTTWADRYFFDYND